MSAFTRVPPSVRRRLERVHRARRRASRRRPVIRGWSGSDTQLPRRVGGPRTRLRVERARTPAAPRAAPGSGSASRCPSAARWARSASRDGERTGNRWYTCPASRSTNGRHRRRQAPAIGGGQRAAPRGPRREVRQPRAQDGRLHFVQAAVHAGLDVMVAVRLPAVAQTAARDRRAPCRW